MTNVAVGARGTSPTTSLGIALRSSRYTVVVPTLQTLATQLRRAARGWTTLVRRRVPSQRTGFYERTYEAHALVHDDALAVGGADFEDIGRVELKILEQAGLRTSDTLLDMGCGTGRLAIHAIPYLTDGRYIGTDVAPTMLARCRANLQRRQLDLTRVELVQQPERVFPVADASIDAICAFSVFTHIELEDCFSYLADARRAIHPQGFCVISCFPVENIHAKSLLEASSSKSIDQRMLAVRNYVTSKSIVEHLASWTGWSVREWIDGDLNAFVVGSSEAPVDFGQSVVVLHPV